MRFIRSASFVVFMCAVSAFAADVPQYVIILKDHKFSPAMIEIPAKQKVKLIIKNQSDTAAEFESYELNREKVIAPHGEVVVFIGPLKAGDYAYFDDFHPKDSKAVIRVK